MWTGAVCREDSQGEREPPRSAGCPPCQWGCRRCWGHLWAGSQQHQTLRRDRGPYGRAGCHAPAPAPTRCPLKGSATNRQCVCPPLNSLDAGTLMLCVKDSCPPARLSSDPGLGARPADPGVGHSGAAGWLQNLSPIQVSGQQRHFPGMLVSREAPRKLLEMHHVLLAGPGDMAPARMCSHGAAASEKAGPPCPLVRRLPQADEARAAPGTQF